MIFPNFDPVLIHIGPLAIRWYALAYVAGILLGWRYALNLMRNLKLWAGETPPTSVEQLDDLILWVTLGIILGGRLGYVLFYAPELIWHEPLEILRVWHGGMSFHGGFLGVTVALIAFARTQKLPFLSLSDLIAPAAPIGLFFGRIANFINGELWGRPTNLPWGIIFPAGGPQPRHPSQIYECLLEGAVLFLILLVATHKGHWLRKRGAVSGLFLAGYGLLRITLETVREPDRFMPSFPLGLTMGMLLSTPMLLVGLWLIRRSRAAQLALGDLKG
ncbi:MAG: prolipoprotein diacylglyceryl transferase [Alphaproteobacteria bacterium]